MIKNILIGLICFVVIWLFSPPLTMGSNITFPIKELGGCTNASTCKVYCDQIENHQACTEFAKSRGLYKEKVNQQQVSILSSAKEELGCDSINECKTFCEQEENRLRCLSFAQRHGLTSRASSDKEEILQIAKGKLGCDSYESCYQLCEQEANFTKCAAFAQSQITSDDRAMFDKYRDVIKETLGCDSIVTCMAFCINPLNRAKCEELGSKIGSSEAPSMEPPEVWCPKISSECKWDGTNCVCNGPQTCSQSNDIPGCSWDGTQCNCPGIEGSPEEWCPKAGSGCAWDGGQCTCPGSDNSTGSEVTQPTTEPGEVWCPRLGPYCVWDNSSCTCWDDCMKAGGTWTGIRCDLPQEQTTTQTPDQIYATPEPGEVWCPRSPGCSWTGEVCQCTPVLAPQTEPTPTPTVQGATTNQSLFQQIIDFLF